MAATVPTVKGVWLEFKPTQEWCEKFHQLRTQALSNTTQQAKDVHLTVLYLGKEVTDEIVDDLWNDCVNPFLQTTGIKRDYPFKCEQIHIGDWGPPVVMMRLKNSKSSTFESLYRAFYQKALDLGIKVAGTNASPEKHNGYHITIDKREEPLYTQAEVDGVKLRMRRLLKRSVPFESVRLVRGDDVLFEHHLKDKLQEGQRMMTAFHLRI
jgi:hypothetical protein